MGEGNFIRRESERERREREKREERRKQVTTRRRILFSQCLFGEKLGPHPGRVGATIYIYLYDAIRQETMRVPGLKIELGIETQEGLVEAMLAAERGIRLWLEGRMICERCERRLV